ncbi:hypothetical protein M9H77_31023 [Catharanthus roseus]|uniref:Uncharacterized protein n=1 Tax=Catharanthus roseus TaxID=4058 RepID=A0ACC0A2U0_CATRO|nr:hypothetical protein M9H77_31023 [Catharanthus roseus]
MEEVPTQVYPGPLVPDVLTRQHGHRSALIWSGDHETCFTNLQCRHFDRSLFQCYSTASCRLVVVHGSFRGCTTDIGALVIVQFVWLPYHDRGLVPSDLWPAESYSLYILDACDARLDLHRIQLKGNDHTYWGTQHASHVEVWHQGRLRVRDVPVLATEVLSYPNDEYIRWNRGIIRVYIGNLANRDTCSVGYQPARVDRQMMAIIRRYMVSIGGALGCTPSQHDIQQTFPIQLSRRRPCEPIPDQSAHGVKRDTRRQPGRGAGGGRPPVPHFPSRHGHADVGHVEVERGEGSAEVERGEGSGGGHPPIDPFDSPNLDTPSFSLGLMPPSQSLPGGSGTLRAPPPLSLGFALFRSPHHTSLGFSSFPAPPPRA